MNLKKIISQFFIVSYIVTLVSCAHQKGYQQSSPDMVINVEHIKTSEKVTSPGWPLLVQVPEKEKSDLKIDRVLCDQKSIPFEHRGKQVNFYWAESYFSTAKSHNCYLYNKEKLIQKVHIKVEPYEYPFEELRVGKRRVVVNLKDQTRVKKEREFLSRIYAKSSKTSYYSQGFTVPLESFITSHYGKRRIFNGVRKTQHLGVDLRARTGVPIPSSQRGRVVYAGELFYSGNTVIIDHGLGVFTTYGHLSKMLIRMGEVVEQGQFIGLAGSSGRVTGPHLHWGTKIHGHWVDGMVLVEQSKSIRN